MTDMNHKPQVKTDNFHARNTQPLYTTKPWGAYHNLSVNHPPISTNTYLEDDADAAALTLRFLGSGSSYVPIASSARVSRSQAKSPQIAS